MKNKFTIVCSILGLLSGCAEINSTDLSVTATDKTVQKIDLNIANAILATIVDLDVQNDFDFIFDGKSYPLVSSAKIQKYLLETPSEKQISTPHVKAKNYISFSDCYYLGNHNGKHVVFRYNNPGSLHYFTHIWWLTLDKGKLKLDKSLFFGYRAMDGLSGFPKLTPNGKVYFKTSLSTYGLGCRAGLSDEQSNLFNSYADYWNSAEISYDPETDDEKILSMDIYLDGTYSSDIEKMLKKIFPNQKSTVHIDEDHTDDFINKFKAASIELFEEKERANQKSSDKK